MVTNGQVPVTQLSQVEGWAYLAPGCAAAWRAFDADMTARTGRSLTITSPDGAYRTRARQQWWWDNRKRLGIVVAVPGTSNHGLGMAVDISNHASFNRALLVSVARAHGFIFDTPSESWHVKYTGTANYAAASTSTTTQIQSQEDDMRWFAVRDANGKTVLGVTVGATSYTEINPDTDPVEYALERDLYSYPNPYRFISPEQWRITKEQIVKRRKQLG